MSRKQRPKRKQAKGVVRCKYCGAAAKRSIVGGETYTTVAPHLGACMDCIIRAMQPGGGR